MPCIIEGEFPLLLDKSQLIVINCDESQPIVINSDESQPIEKNCIYFRSFCVSST